LYFLTSWELSNARCSTKLVLCPTSGSCSNLYTCRSRYECDYYDSGSFCSTYCLSNSRSCSDIEDQDKCESYRDCSWGGGGTGVGSGSRSGGAKAGITIAVLLIIGGLAAVGVRYYRIRIRREVESDPPATEAVVDKDGTEVISKQETDVDDCHSHYSSIARAQSKNDIETGGEAGERKILNTRIESVFRDRFRKWRQQRVVGRSIDDEKESDEAKASTSTEREENDEDSTTLVGSGNIWTCQAESCVVS